VIAGIDRRGAVVAIGILAAIPWSAGTAGPPPSPRVRLLTADLPDSLLQELSKQGALDADAAGLRERILEVSSEVADAGLVRVRTDPRWFPATPPEGAGAPFLEIRRWPGDSVVSFYALAGKAEPGGTPPIDGSERSDAARQPQDHWTGTIPTAAGRRPAAWLDAPVPGGNRRLGTLLLPGDAGLGPDAIPALFDEMEAIARSAEIRVEAWAGWPVIAAGAPLELPRLLPPAAAADERKDVWQSIQTRGFSLSLPPGIRAMRLGNGVQAPRMVDRSVLWLRGRFADRDGMAVVLGDGMRAGYVAVVDRPETAWREGRRPPLGAAAAKRIAAEDFSAACEGTGAKSATAERWSEPGFAGDWIVFRLAQPGQGTEIGLPVLSGRQSEAIFWIPASWRAAGLPLAPPPLDPARRFGMDYRPLTKLEQAKQAWMAGVLTVPGLRIEVPARWFAVVNLRSSDGYPIVFNADDRRAMGRLVRHPAGSAALSGESLAAWQAVKRPSKKSLEASYRRDDGARLFVTDRGDGLVFLPEAAAGDPKWERMVETIVPLRTELKDTAPARGP